jgi:MFS family permease
MAAPNADSSSRGSEPARDERSRAGTAVLRASGIRRVGGIFPASGPQRVLAWAWFVNLVGTGMFLNVSALFFTRSVGLAVPKVAAGLTIGGLVGLAGGVPAGHLADRVGPRLTWLVSLCVEGVLMAAFAFVHSFAAFVLLVCSGQLAAAASAAARTPVIRRLAGANAAELQARLRAINNLASSLGLVMTAVVVQLDTRPAYLALLFVNALSFLGCAAIGVALPRMPPLPAPAKQRRWVALADRPFVGLAALELVMSLQYPVLTFAMPLWIVGHTGAPRWIAPAAALLNTVLVVLLQVRVSRGVDSVSAAGRSQRGASFVLCAAFVLMASAAGLPGWVAATVVVAAVAVQTLGEVRQAAAAFVLTFGLAPAHAQGQYGGLYGTSHSMAFAIGPSVLGLLCLGIGVPGWAALGGLLVVAGMLTPATVAWAERTRPAGEPRRGTGGEDQ